MIARSFKNVQELEEIQNDMLVSNSEVLAIR
jgi:hypothetical protein